MRNINLFIVSYKDKNPDRDIELITCLKINKSNKDLNVVDFNGSELTYKELFQRMDGYPDDINILANSDIYFDESINLLRDSFDPDTCFALTRWDLINSESEFYNRNDSQDAWIFFGSVKNLNNINGSYTLGTPGCDNRIAMELYNAGYKVLNPSKTIKALHLHRSGVRNYNPERYISGEYLLIDPSTLEEKDTKYHFIKKW